MSKPVMKNNFVMPLHSHYGYLKKLECLKLEAKFNSDYIAPTEPKMASINHDFAAWEIELPNGKQCRMSACFGAIDDEFYVVHVDAQKFYYYWLISSLFLDDSHRTNHCVLLKDMQRDYKFEHAVEGFKNTENNPVPLANLSARFEHNNPYIGFTNGVTRTMWLLSNGAKSFPVEVHGEHSANYLYDFAGIGDRPITFKQLRDMHHVKNPHYL